MIEPVGAGVMMAVDEYQMETPEERARAWLHENADAITAEATYIEVHGIPGAALAVNSPKTEEGPHDGGPRS